MERPRKESLEVRAVARGLRVVLVRPHASDEEELLELRRASWDFLAPWELDLPGVDPLGPSWFARYLRIGPEHRRQRWLVRLAQDGAICGSITVGEIDERTGRASLGYWISASHARRGLMSEALVLALELAFRELGVRELHAYVLPENAPSRALLARLGFRIGGVARGYRVVRGVERDHERWELSAPSRAGSGSPG
jgi:ribosomal-protein-alanine N-acetyltransferase